MKHLNEVIVSVHRDIDFWSANKGPFGIKCVNKTSADLIYIDHEKGGVGYITKKDLCDAYIRLDGEDGEYGGEDNIMTNEINALKPKDWWDPGDGKYIYVCLK